MESAILGILALMLTVMLYLDRSRRTESRDLRLETNAGTTGIREEMKAETLALRGEMNAGFAGLREEMKAETLALRGEMNAGFTGLREEIKAGFAAHREEMKAETLALRQEIRTSSSRTDTRIDQLTTAVINLAESLGQVKGRTEVLVTAE